MLRPLTLASTLALLLAAPALAQAPAATPRGAAPSQLQQSGLTPPTILSQGYSASGEDILVTVLLGETVYAGPEDDAQQIGKVKDMVVTSGQGISAVVLGVGGFLGVGEKDVAVDFTQLQHVEREDGSRRWVLPTTAEALSAAPAFIWSDSEAARGPEMTPEEEQEQLVDGDPNAAPIDPELTTDQPEADATATPPLDRTGFSEVDQAGLTADQLRGIAVYGINDEQIGTIGNVVETPEGAIDAVIVDVGGFLGLGAKPVAVGFDNLVFSADTAGMRYLFINASREQLEAQPTFDPLTYATDRDEQRMVIVP